MLRRLFLLLAALPFPLLAAAPVPAGLASAPVLAVPAQEVARALADAKPVRGNHGPLRIATMIGFSAGLADGAWTDEDGGSVWRLHLHSDGATLLIAHFDRLALPDGAALRFMRADGSVVHGPYTRKDASRARDFWTPFVRGEDAIVEIRVPPELRGEVRWHLAQVAHGIADPALTDAIQPRSGSCEIDVVCPAGDAWRDEIRSAAKVQIPSSTSGFVNLCSGTLMNNVRQDGTPYFLTADHCELNASNASGVVVYWNFQTSTCGGTPDGSETQTTSGSTFMAESVSADYTLARLSTTPPAAFHVHYAGFDARTTDTPSSGASIHHPSGDEKRISLFTLAPTRTTVTIEKRHIQSFEVFWTQGVTEPGSSGSGLWNQDRQLVGVLSGGGSSCSAPHSSDFYGRLDTAWTTGLQAFLDPDDTGQMTLCGTDPGITCGAASNHAPVAVADAYTVAANSRQNLLRVRRNDHDPDGDATVISRVTRPTQGGTARAVHEGTLIRYTPAADFAGEEKLRYILSDGHGGTDTGFVTISVKSP